MVPRLHSRNYMQPSQTEDKKQERKARTNINEEHQVVLVPGPGSAVTFSMLCEQHGGEQSRRSNRKIEERKRRHAMNAHILLLGPL